MHIRFCCIFKDRCKADRYLMSSNIQVPLNTINKFSDSIIQINSANKMLQRRYAPHLPIFVLGRKQSIFHHHTNFLLLPFIII